GPDGEHSGGMSLSSPWMVRYSDHLTSTPQPEFGSMNGYMARLRDHWGDSLLTLLTALLAVMMFVLAPLQAMGSLVFQVFELAVAVILIVSVFVLSGSRIAAAAMLTGLAMVVVGAILRMRSPSMIEMDLVVGSWLIFATT